MAGAADVRPHVAGGSVEAEICFVLFGAEPVAAAWGARSRVRRLQDPRARAVSTAEK